MMLQVLRLLGKPGYGILYTSQMNKIPLDPSYFEPLEEHLSKYERYFRRYTTEDSIQVRIYYTIQYNLV